MKYYTFIMNYMDGVYISQVNASNEIDAMRVWLKMLDVKHIKGFSEEEKQNLIIDDFSDEIPVPIEGCKNVWCFGLRTSHELALINFISTIIK